MGLDIDELASLFTGRENHYTINEGEESVILTHSYIETGMVLGSALTLDDITGFALRPTKNLHSETFAF